VAERLDAAAVLESAAKLDGAGLLLACLALARLSHPNLVSIFDVLQRGDELVLAMEYVAGTSMRRWMAQPDAQGPDA
jgi:serine/threonine protein kinase